MDFELFIPRLFNEIDFVFVSIISIILLVITKAKLNIILRQDRIGYYFIDFFLLITLKRKK